jgi:hypothetical protein
MSDVLRNNILIVILMLHIFMINPISLSLSNFITSDDIFDTFLLSSPIYILLCLIHILFSLLMIVSINKCAKYIASESLPRHLDIELDIHSESIKYSDLLIANIVVNIYFHISKLISYIIYMNSNLELYASSVYGDLAGVFTCGIIILPYIFIKKCC